MTVVNDSNRRSDTFCLVAGTLSAFPLMIQNLGHRAHLKGERLTYTDPSRQARAGCERCPILAAMTQGDPVAKQWCERMTDVNAAPRKQFFREGEKGNEVFLVRKGEVKLSSVDASGREHVVAILGPGEMFGFEVLENQRHDTSATALRYAEVCVSTAEHMRQSLHGSQALGRYMTRTLVTQLRDARSLQLCLGTVRSTAKVAAWLSRRATRDEDGVLAVQRSLTLMDLAGLLGLAHETACRSLGELERAGIIRTDGQRWIVDSAESLGEAGKIRNRTKR